MKRKIYLLYLVFLVVKLMLLSACGVTRLDVYISQNIDSVQTYRLVIDGENYGFIPYSAFMKDCKDTSQLLRARLYEGSYKAQVQTLSGEIVIRQTIGVSKDGVVLSGLNPSGEVKATNICAMIHFFNNRKR